MIKLTHNKNSHTLTLGTLTLYFSYETCVGFEKTGFTPVFTENRWGPTTGKHLNEFGSDKDDRLGVISFDHALAKLHTEHNLG